jgi:hypothetical protein
MKYVGLIKKALWGALAAGIILGTSIPVYCTNYTSMEEYVKSHREQAAKAGYESTSDLSDWGFTAPSNASTSSASTNSNKNPVKSCEHTYTDSIIKEPTCAESGVLESKCSKCGDTYKTEIPATGKHEYSSEVTKEATCSEKGEIAYTCTVCGDSYTEVIPMKEHTYESSIAEDATCTTAGIRVFICTGCDDSYTEEIPATGHDGKEMITKEAGFFTSGEKVVKCSICGEILSTEVIPSRAPIYYLYIGIVLLVVIVITALVLIFKSTKHGISKVDKIA